MMFSVKFGNTWGIIGVIHHSQIHTSSHAGWSFGWRLLPDCESSKYHEYIYICSMYIVIFMLHDQTWLYIFRYVIHVKYDLDHTIRTCIFHLYFYIQTNSNNIHSIAPFYGFSLTTLRQPARPREVCDTLPQAGEFTFYRHSMWLENHRYTLW